MLIKSTLTVDASYPLACVRMEVSLSILMAVSSWEAHIEMIVLKYPTKNILVGGWATPLKNMNVNWDDDIPNIWENKIDVPNHQPVSHCWCFKYLLISCDITNAWPQKLGRRSHWLDQVNHGEVTHGYPLGTWVKFLAIDGDLAIDQFQSVGSPP